jgi:osmoprotectant transport system permease protein
VAGLTPDFIGRPDGLPALERMYGFRPRAVRSLLQTVKYTAIAAGSVDVIDGYSTDGLIARHGLVVLEDDRGLFPPYEAAPLVSARLVHELPAAVQALERLSGRLDVRTMRALNRRVEVDGEDVRVVARNSSARWESSPPARGVDAAPRGDGGFFRTLGAPRRDGAAARRHLLLVTISLAAALLVAIPLGLSLERWRAGAEWALRGTGVLQTIPSIALLAFMIPLLGIGLAPALVALFLYSLYPILRNTYTGVRDAAPEAVASARALGMADGALRPPSTGGASHHGGRGGGSTSDGDAGRVHGAAAWATRSWPGSRCRMRG